MTNDRAQAYGRVIRTLDDISAVKLLPSEVERIRAAADTLLFATNADESVRGAVANIESLAQHLVDSERWTEERARDLVDALLGCGPLQLIA
jgi:hypothetical protein